MRSMAFVPGVAARWHYLRCQKAFHRSPVQVLWRLTQWRCHCLAGIGATVHLPRWDVRIYLPPWWRGIAKLIFAFREDYEPELGYLDRLLTSGDGVIDVGACLGIYTLALARLVGPAGEVFSFEPAPVTHQVLRRNVALNRLSNVRVYQQAIADVGGVARLWMYDDPGRNSLGRFPGRAAGVAEVVATTLDTVVSAEGVSALRLVKLDVEGAEELVLRGAADVLGQMRPAIIFEVNPGAARALGLTPDGAWRFLASLGYRFWKLEPSAGLQAMENLPPGGNVLALPGGAR